MTATTSLFSQINTLAGAAWLSILLICIAAAFLLTKLFNKTFFELIHIAIIKIMNIIGKFVGNQEKVYHRDLAIGKINEKRNKVKLYRFFNDLIIDLQLSKTGMTPYEFMTIIVLSCALITTILSQIILGSAWMTIVMTPIVIVGITCGLYTRANIAHDARIEAVIEAENIICNSIKTGVVPAVRENMAAFPLQVRPDFIEFLDDVEQKNYHIKTALMGLNNRLGGIADDFIKKCIVFELEEEHGLVGMFSDVVEVNNIKMEMRTMMKRKFDEVKRSFIIGAAMIFAFLGSLLFLYDEIAAFYFKTGVGQVILAIDALIFISEFVFITYLRAKEL